MRIIFFFVIGVTSIIRSASADSQLTLPTVLSDGLVLQQQKPVRIWGKDTPGTVVQIELFAGNSTQPAASAQATTDATGHFLAELPPRDASFTPYRLHVKDELSSKDVKNILFGELWLSGGQSNMHLPLEFIIGREKYLADANNPHLRIFHQTVEVARVYAQTPKDDTSTPSAWQIADNPDGMKDISGITYVFADALFKWLNRDGKQVPVAFLNTAVGATSIQAWLSPDCIRAHPALMTRYPKAWITTADKEAFNQATVEYNDRIAPLNNLAVRGMVWSQGENDVGGSAAGIYYKEALMALAKDWRAQFRCEDGPFIVAQLHPRYFWPDLECVANLREAQLEASAESPNMIAVPIQDIPLTWNDGPFKYKSPSHPLQKAPVGIRMAIAARGMAYGDSVEYHGPMFAGLKIEGGKAIVSFTHADHGLKIGGDTGSLGGFAICGEDRVFLPAVAAIVGQTVEVTSAVVEHPVAVTYGYTSLNQDANLFNTDGQPADPFRSDKVKSRYWAPQPWMSCDTLQFWMCEKTTASFEPTWMASGNPAGGRPTFSLDTAQKTEGKSSLTVSYDVSKAADAVAFEPAIPMPKSLDLADYRSLSFDVFNPDAVPKKISLQCEIKDVRYAFSSEQGDQDVTIAPGKWTQVQFNLQAKSGTQPSGAADAKSELVTRLLFLLKAPVGKGSIRLDNFQFSSTASSAANR